MKPPVHERVAGHFEAAGLTHAEIAQEVERRTREEWSERKVIRLLTGTTDLKVKHLEIFASILGKPVTELIAPARKRAS